MYEIRICDVQVEAKSVSVSNEAITDRRKEILFESFDKHFKIMLEKNKNLVHNIINSYIEDNPYIISPPVNGYYTQYTNENGVFNENQSPAVIYRGTTWKTLFNQDAVTFRTEGSLSNEGRGSDGIQGDSIRNIFGYVSGMAEMSLQTLPTGPFYFVTEGGGYASGGP